ncbi:MAG: AAA family ATPase, partial [Rickettsiales bacterium]|nr:AAA family ATPase [Rickettsiales bacterium]
MKINKNPIKKNRSNIFLILFVVLFGAVLWRVFNPGTGDLGLGTGPIASHQQQTTNHQMNFSEFLTAAADKKIATVAVNGDTATGALSDGGEYSAVIERDPALITRLAESGAAVTIDNSRSIGDLLLGALPWILMVLFFLWISGRARAGMGGLPPISSMNPSKIVAGKTKITFKDVAGIETEKAEVMEIVDFLKNPAKYKHIGARVPRGVLLSGEPGTGKTLMAKAIAGEANVPFFASSGSDFSGIIIGLGVAKIKELFDLAKKNSPCILFIDEIDAIGQSRGRGGISDQDREQTLNQLLIEMDGFATDAQVIVIGATNRPDLLDGALLRPGRFDRQVYIELPDLSGREAILNLYAKKFKIDSGVDLHELARGTTGMSGADLENLLNEAALGAARTGRKSIIVDDIEEARDKTLMGPKKSRKMRAEDKKLTAYHEAGHAFVATYYRDITDEIHKATIVPRGRALGMVQHLPIDDKVSVTRAELAANLAILMAGRVAEESFFGPDKITTGAESDIAVATKLARRAVTMWGMSSKLGPVAINQVTNFGRRTAL